MPTIVKFILFFYIKSLFVINFYVCDALSGIHGRKRGMSYLAANANVKQFLLHFKLIALTSLTITLCMSSNIKKLSF